jgi:hypothetical protein
MGYLCITRLVCAVHLERRLGACRHSQQIFRQYPAAALIDTSHPASLLTAGQLDHPRRWPGARHTASRRHKQVASTPRTAQNDIASKRIHQRRDHTTLPRLVLPPLSPLISPALKIYNLQSINQRRSSRRARFYAIPQCCVLVRPCCRPIITRRVAAGRLLSACALTERHSRRFAAVECHLF